MKREDFKEVIELPKEFIGKGSVGGAKFSQCFCGDGYYIYKKQLKAENGFKTPNMRFFLKEYQRHLTLLMENSYRMMKLVRFNIPMMKPLEYGLGIAPILIQLKEF